jgi:hypothetical protein
MTGGYLSMNKLTFSANAGTYHENYYNSTQTTKPAKAIKTFRSASQHPLSTENYKRSKMCYADKNI